MRLLTVICLLAAPTLAATTITTFSVAATSYPFNGTDPFGNPFQITASAGGIAFSIPGPLAISGGASCQWQGPDCLTAVKVVVWEETASGDIAIDFGDAAVPGLMAFRNDSTGNAFYKNLGVHTNFVEFGALTTADWVRPGQQMSGFVVSPYPRVDISNPLRFEVTYFTEPCPVPEPGSMTLVGIAIAGLYSVRRWKPPSTFKTWPVE